jgi:hypothetical protein
LAGDFLYKVFQYCGKWLEENDIKSGTSILVAEPLMMQTGLVTSDWLSNYRRNIKRLLAGKQIVGKNFENIDFLPEPFAVFQYYRYGLKHPIVSERTKHYALVIDFGGGTFDTCIIEITKEGDINQTLRNLKL